MQLLINHLGYETDGPKQAILMTQQPRLTCDNARLVDATTHLTVAHYTVHQGEKVANWPQGYFHQIDFSTLNHSGQFYLIFEQTQSPVFEVKPHLLLKRTFSDLLHYFKSQRCGGQFEQADHQVPIFQSNRQTSPQKVDVHGGWYDASGDVSKYLSHLSYANYFNPQQIPMVVWSFLKSHQTLTTQQMLAPFVTLRLEEEALYGADFLMRMQAPSGYFYMTVFDQWSKHTDQREICAYQTQNGDKSQDHQSGFRQGGGMTIAALARIARWQLAGDYTPQQYLHAAESGYQHLREYNKHYLDDGCENIIDEYCALLACVELYKSTQRDEYLKESRIWADRVCQRQLSDNNFCHFWSANNDGSRPYYHAAEAGLPGLALCELLTIESDNDRKQRIKHVIIQACEFELTITHATNNPFGYPRQYVKPLEQPKHDAFFIAQNNETGYWWQGENARLASLASFAYQAAELIDDSNLGERLLNYAQHAIDWILGLNPYDICMLDGHGRNNPDYLPQLGFFNAKGGICNGITAGVDDADGIAFNPEPHCHDLLQNWRWGEQWIPHAAWFLLAISQQTVHYSAHSSQH